MKRRILAAVLTAGMLINWTSITYAAEPDAVTAQPETAVSAEELEEELYNDSLELLACCVEAEAGNQGIEGKRLVADAVLNRVDNPAYPDNIWDVIMQSYAGIHQFSVISDGRIYEVEPTEESFLVVQEELERRASYDVLFFTADKWPEYGTPWKKVGDHYFNTK